MSQFGEIEVDFDAEECPQWYPNEYIEDDDDADPTFEASARASGELQSSPSPERPLWHANQLRPRGRCQANSLRNRSVWPKPEDEPPQGSSAKAHKRGHFTIGTINKGDKATQREQCVDDALHAPSTVLFLQDTLHHLHHFHVSAGKCLY